MKDILIKYGMNNKKDRMFPCAYYFLFQENEDVEEITQRFREQLLTNNNYTNHVDSNVTSNSNDNGKYKTRRSRKDVQTRTTATTTTTTTKDNNNSHTVYNTNAATSTKPHLIGIGIRAGDQSFVPLHDQHTSAIEKYQFHIQCAQEIEEALLLSDVANTTAVDSHKVASSTNFINYNTRWYVMADSLHVRQALQARYPEKIITDTFTFYFHGDCMSKRMANGCSQQALKMAIIHAVSQLQLFAMCDVHIISDIGFPRIGMMLSILYKAIHHSNNGNKNSSNAQIASPLIYSLDGNPEHMPCTKYPTSLDQMMSMGAKIR
jgi:hypothetical protein